MVQGTGQLIDLGFLQYCSLTILCRLSDRATFNSLRMNGYNTEIENILQKDSTFGDGTWSRLVAVPTLPRIHQSWRERIPRDRGEVEP